MIKGRKCILWVFSVLLSSVGPYCFSQSQSNSVSDFECGSPGNTNLNDLRNQIGSAALATVLIGCHGENNGGADDSNENSDDFVGGIDVVNERIVTQGGRGNLTESEGVDKRAGLSSGRRSWREIFINW